MRAPETNAARAVIENPHAFEAVAQAEALEAAGFETVICPGPQRDESRCWLLSEGDCPLAANADVVLFGLDLENPVDRAVLRALGRRYPGKPVVAELPTDTSRHHAEDVTTCTVVVPYSMEHLAQAAVDALLANTAHQPDRGRT
jgi:hypothetical protein